MIIEVNLYSNLRTLYTEGESLRPIAKRLGVSRQTVKKYCEGNTHPGVRKKYDRLISVATGEVKDFILNCFQQDDEAEKLAKQMHTAKRIYDHLISE